MNMIIAIDGPAASGKGTIGRRLANELHLAFLDTGLIYRAATKKIMERNVSPFNIEEVCRVIGDMTVAENNENDLRSPEISKITPHIAGIKQVREILTKIQRDFAHNPPQGYQGAILDGRDIGTIICPDANVKIFITADLRVRAKRRYKELTAQGIKTSFQTVHGDLRRRDEQDASRSIAPLKPAANAVILDTTHLTADEAFVEALAIVNAKMPETRRASGSTPL